MTGGRRLLTTIAVLACAAAALAWLRDPPWLASRTFGLREWEEDAGVRYRWTNGHASFYVPSDAVRLAIPMRIGEASSRRAPLRVTVSVDDKVVTVVTLTDPMAWDRAVVPLPRRDTGRHLRRVDILVPRTTEDMNYGVQLGDIETERGPGS